ncbi:MAG TPA: LytTR family DNA-binding domain-containing protein [Allosphingosinicella sp.]|nr:LytTR family DNA-binding domain-containing protein [Allosphingosinicella sp.]
MTSGDRGGTSGAERQGWWLPWLLFALIGAINAAVNATSVGDDLARLGHPVPAWQPWTWELTSMGAWLALAPVVFAAAARLRPPRFRWPAALAVHALLSIAVSLAHVGLMMAARMSIYAAVGGAYRFAGSVPGVLLYEYRKDLVTYLLLALLFALARRLAPPAAAAGQGFRLEVRDGSRTAWLAPEDIEWAQAAGNYVELHGRFGERLHRETLASLEAILVPHGFRRIHRSRLVRAAAVKEIETKTSGDFELTMESGDRLAGSRRFRGRLRT